MLHTWAVRRSSPARARPWASFAFVACAFASTATLAQGGRGHEASGLRAAAPADGDDEGEQPRGATLTAWGKHGGRKWSVCNERVIEAERALPSFNDQAQHLGREHAWAQRAQACPHAIAVLELAARKESLHLVRLPDGLDAETPLEGVRKELGESRERALGWLREAEREAARRDAPVPPQLDYWRARVHLSLGQVEAAAQALARAEARADVPEAKRLRLRALIELYSGDLDAATRTAARAYREAKDRDANGRSLPDPTLAAAIYAVVLDRAGDDEGAKRLLRLADRSGDRGSLSLQRLETFMPLSERVYFRALWMSSVRSNDASLAIRYFKAYMAQPDVPEPERKLAARHVERLEKRPGRLGG